VVYSDTAEVEPVSTQGHARDDQDEAEERKYRVTLEQEQSMAARKAHKAI